MAMSLPHLTMLADLAQRVETLETEVAHLRLRLRKDEHTMSSTADEVTQLEGEVSDVATVVDDLDTHLTDAKNEIQALQAANPPPSLKTMIDSLAGTIQRAKTTLASMPAPTPAAPANASPAASADPQTTPSPTTPVSVGS